MTLAWSPPHEQSWISSRTRFSRQGVRWTDIESERTEAAVLVISHHSVVRRGLSAIIREVNATYRVTAAAAGYEAESLAEAVQPNLIVIDMIDQPAPAAAALCSELIARIPGTAVLVVAAASDATMIRSCLDLGAVGCVSPDSDERVIAAATAAALCGQRFIDPGVAYAMTRREYGRAERDSAHLTPRERDVLRLLSEGCSNRAISTRLAITEKTVKGHVSSILAKLQVDSRLAAALKASEIL
jgi:DNA-binding NarL/FixJ family response regulator